MTASGLQLMRSVIVIAFVATLFTTSAATSATAVWTTTAFNGSDGGACVFGPLAKTAYGALNFAGSAPIYANGANCGICYKVSCAVTGVCSSSGVTVTQTDFCSGTTVCSATSTTVALSGYAFGKMAVAGKETSLRTLGKVPVTITRVPCSYPVTAPIKFRVLSSYNGYYFPLSVINVAGPGALSGVSILPAAAKSYIALVRQYGEIWTPPSGAGFIAGPIAVKLTAIIAGVKTTVACTSKIPAGFSFTGTVYYSCGAQFAAKI
eukprot:TRINITY_DN3138_c1_g2_i1.p1 TRINITY_DN3138_c1_g2~~TRINITY_DN3138_c1_g2_i1.p1  ORF type:complete len:264 (-),score=28.44 TRINITY_DN3138_c1_g2_i1:576-1367(-)